MPNFRPLECFILVYFGVVVVVIVVLATWLKQSQLLVPRLKSGLGTGV